MPIVNQKQHETLVDVDTKWYCARISQQFDRAEQATPDFCSLVLFIIVLTYLSSMSFNLTRSSPTHILTCMAPMSM